MALAYVDHGWLAGHGQSAESIPGGILARMRRAGQQADARGLLPKLQSHEYSFLVGTLIDRATLERAEAEALDCGAKTHEVLLAAGWISPANYAAALAHALGVPYGSWRAEIDAGDADEVTGVSAGLPGHIGGEPCQILVATGGAPDAIRDQVADLLARGVHVVLASGFRVDATIESHFRDERVDRAVRKLLREQPTRSSGTAMWNWQVIAAAVTAGVIVGGFVVLPETTIAALSGFVALPFLCVTMLRVIALREVLTKRTAASVSKKHTSVRLPSELLPSYSVLVPLLFEPNVLPQLIRSLRALDYPAVKLEVLLVLEAADTVTQAALLNIELPGNFRTVVVPDQEPRTKPKALNYALQFARGDYVVVYDAEDRPQPEQLRLAVEFFRRAPPTLGCLQAQLNIYNPRDSWFTRGIMAQTP